LSAFEKADAVLSKFVINANAQRVAHFMAQVLHETGGLTILRESMNYSAKRLPQVWPDRFKTAAKADAFAHKPRELANEVYNGRMGNRTGTDDGWNYIGRGLLQITGREDYKKYGEKLGVDLVADPELAIHPDHTLSLAALEWDAKSC